MSVQKEIQYTVLLVAGNPTNISIEVPKYDDDEAGRRRRRKMTIAMIMMMMTLLVTIVV